MKGLGGDLYLFKSSRRPLYRQQNLRLLGDERGAVMELTWNRSWLAPACWEPGAIAAGARVVFVLTDRPYALFAPVREGEVVEARWEDVSLRLWVTLGTWLRLSVSPGEYADRLRAAQGGLLPGEKFVVPRLDDTELVRCYDAEEDAGWRSAIEATLAADASAEEPRYGGSVFFRAAGLRRDGEAASTRWEPLPVGRDVELLLRFHNPHLRAERLDGLELRAEPVTDALRVRARKRIPEGAAADEVVTLKAVGADPALVVQVLPDPSSHTSLTLRFALAGEPVAGTRRAGGAASIRVADLIGLREAVRRARPLPADRELPLVEAALRLMPDDARLAERRAVLLERGGDAAGAFAALRALDAELLDDEGRFLLFRLLSERGEASAAAALLSGHELGGGERLEQLLRELDRLEPPLLDRVVREIVRQLADDATVRAILPRVAHRLTSPELIAETARHFYLLTGDARGAASFLRERRHALQLVNPSIAVALLELAEAGADDDTGELYDAVSHRIANLLGRNELEDALALLRRARPRLGRDDRDRLYHRTADRLLERDEREAAAGLLIELADAAAQTGDLEAASDAVERARGVYAADGARAPGWVRDAVRRIDAAWSDVEKLHEWRASERDRRADLLRARLLNRTILVAGGFKRDRFEAPLQQLTGATIEFGESFRTERDAIEPLAQRIRSGRYALVVFRWMFTSHDVSDALKRACEETGVPFTYATGGGLRGIEDAIWNAAGENHDS